MKQFVTALLLSTSYAASSVGDACHATTDCTDTAGLCCGVAANCMVVDDTGKKSTTAVQNVAICNKQPGDDGKSMAEKFSGILADPDQKFSIKYECPAAHFSCFKETPAPPAPVTPPKFPTEGVGLACTGPSDDCGKDTTMCCGLAKDGFIVGSDGSKTTKAIPNAAICNKKPGDDGTSKAEVWQNKFLAGDMTTEFTFRYPKEGFSCFETPAPPKPTPVTPPVFPSKGIGHACAGADTDCGKDDSGDELCCGISSSGTIMDSKGNPLKTKIPSAAICNKKPGSDGTPKAQDWGNKLLGGDNTTEFSFNYSGKDFVCIESKKPPTPSPPKPPHNDDTNVGGNCSTNDDCTKNVKDDDKKDDYCCGVATNGQLIDGDGNVIKGSTTNNAVICGMKKAIDVESGYTGSDGTQVTIKYPASGFTCLSYAQSLVASASMLLATAYSMF